jgi:hypothetical protein
MMYNFLAFIHQTVGNITELTFKSQTDTDKSPGELLILSHTTVPQQDLAEFLRTGVVCNCHLIIDSFTLKIGPLF